MHWVVWIDVLLGRMEVESALVPLLLSPTAVWELMVQINQAGIWSIRGWTPTGGSLWGIWIAEAALFFGTVLLSTNEFFADTPFCEECGTWCQKEEDVCRLAEAPAEELVQRLELKDFGYLESLRAPESEEEAHHQLDLESCPRCGQTQALDVTLAFLEQNSEGEVLMSRKKIMENLLLSPEEARAIRSLGERQKEVRKEGGEEPGGAEGPEGIPSA